MRAVGIAGGAGSLARAVGVSPQFVYQWLKGDRRVSPERCADIERATGGKVRCEELRPDLAEMWAYLRGTCGAERHEAA